MRKDIMRKEDARILWPTLFDEFFSDMDRVFGLGSDPATSRMWHPVADVYETDKAYHIDIEVPGIDKKDIEIEVKDRVLSVRGERKFEDEKKEKNYHRSERFYGTFQRSWTLPEGADVEKIAAQYKDGILKIEIPKKPEEQPKKIDIKVK